MLPASIILLYYSTLFVHVQEHFNEGLYIFSELVTLIQIPQMFKSVPPVIIEYN